MSNDFRFPIAALVLSAAAFVGITINEGYTDKAVIPVKGDVPTIGFGTTGGVKVGDTTTPPKALARALVDVQAYEGAIKRCIKVPLTQAEYDAYTDLAYNIGPGAFCNSQIVARVNALDYVGGCEQILRWKFYQGHDCSTPDNKRLCGGIWVRRQAEAKRCRGEQ